MGAAGGHDVGGDAPELPGGEDVLDAGEGAAAGRGRFMRLAPARRDRQDQAGDGGGDGGQHIEQPAPAEPLGGGVGRI